MSDINGLALTLGDSVPSARYRVRQHLGALDRIGLHVVERHPSTYVSAPHNRLSGTGTILSRVAKGGFRVASRLPDAFAARHTEFVWITKWLVPGHVTLEPILGNPLVLDIDDAIWCRGPNGPSTVARLARHATHIIAGNEFLASWLSDHNSSVTVIPTAVDTNQYTPFYVTEGQWMVIGWMGTKQNLGYLQAIEPEIVEAIRGFHARLVVVADAPPRFRLIDPERVEFRRWHPDHEAADLASFDIGLMPLKDGEWERGKCGFKLLQYMASGVPFVASPIGVNARLIELGGGLSAPSAHDWVAQIRHLLNNRDLAAEIGQRGRTVAEQQFSVDVISRQLGSVLRKAASVP